MKETMTGDIRQYHNICVRCPTQFKTPWTMWKKILLISIHNSLSFIFAPGLPNLNLIHVTYKEPISILCIVSPEKHTSLNTLWRTFCNFTPSNATIVSGTPSESDELSNDLIQNAELIFTLTHFHPFLHIWTLL